MEPTITHTDTSTQTELAVPNAHARIASAAHASHGGEAIFASGACNLRPIIKFQVSTLYAIRGPYGTTWSLAALYFCPR
jgi:hypothetical protein